MAMEPLIMVVDDEEANRLTLERILVREGYDVRHAEDGRLALDRIRDEPPALLLTDLKMPGMDGLALMRAARQLVPDLEVILMTAYGTVETAVEAMKEGAYDFVTKPLRRTDLVRSVKNALVKRALVVENRELRSRLARAIPEDVIGRSPAMRGLMEEARQVADSMASVLICGESGTGKGLLARWLHKTSPRRDQPFVTVNCASLPESLLESELFGYERGAFTGATRRKLGYFEVANGGTLLLDEIGEIALSAQVKLLRVIESRTLARLRQTEEIPLDVRLVCATHRDLPAEVAAGKFRQDLYYRISTVTLEVPPLRERPMEIALLARHFLHELARRAGRPAPSVDADASRALAAYSWPGNVRELRNAVEHAFVLTESDAIGVRHLPATVRQSAGDEAAAPSMRDRLDEIEKKSIEAALAAHDGNQTHAAAALGMSRRTLIYKLGKYGLKR